MFCFILGGNGNECFLFCTLNQKITGETPEVSSDKRKPREKKREKREKKRERKREKRSPGSIFINLHSIFNSQFHDVP